MSDADKKKAKSISWPPSGMTADEYRVRAKEMVDYIADYLHGLRDRRVFPDVQPGYMQALLPDHAPTGPEKWEAIFADIERVIMPGITHWQSPYMHAYFPALNSYPSLLGDMLANAISSLGFTWASSPACTELETIVMDWLGKMLGLPTCFLHGDRSSKSMGGGCIQTTASDCTFVTLLAARTEAIRRYKTISPDLEDADINGRLIGYCSDQAHSSVEKAGLIGLVKMRFLHSDENLALRGDTLQDAISTDRERNLIPFYVCATLGTTGACAFDNLKEIGPVCEKEHVWLHIDAAYAGSAFICPEFRSWMAGIEYADSFAFNPSKWLMVHFDCSAMWVKDATALHRTFNVEPLYLQHENSGAAIDYMHWQIALSRRFRSLKLWFVLRCFGVEGLQRHIRRGVDLAIKFEELVRADHRFEVTARRILGMVVFRIAGPNELTEDLLKRLNKQGKVHMVPASLKGKYVIRFTVTSQFTTEDDIRRDWKVIVDMAEIVLTDAITRGEICIDENEEDEDDGEAELAATSTTADGDVGSKQLTASPVKHGVLVSSSETLARKRPVLHSLPHPKTSGPRRREFGISLLLSNVPMSPKVVNGSFAALFDASSLDLDKLARQLIVGGEFIRLSPRKRGKLAFYDKQMSLDYSVLGDRKDNPHRMKMMGSLDSKIDDILEFGSKTQADNQKYKRNEGVHTELEEEDESRDNEEIIKSNKEMIRDGDAEKSDTEGVTRGDHVTVMRGECVAVTRSEGVAVPRSEGVAVTRSEHVAGNGKWESVDRETSNTRSRKENTSIDLKNARIDPKMVTGVCERNKSSSLCGDQPDKSSDLEMTDAQHDEETTLKFTGDSKKISGDPGRQGNKNSRSVLEISKAVCSKVKDVFMTFPGGSVPAGLASDTRGSTSYTSPPGAPGEYCVRGYCKYCGSALPGAVFGAASVIVSSGKQN